MTTRGVASALGAVLAVVGSWIGWREDGSEAVSAARALDGATLFQAKGCAACHTGPASIAGVGGAFPSLADAPSWAGSRRSGMSAEEYLEESIREPWAFISPEFDPTGPTTAMPELGLSDAERDALIAFLLHG